MSETPVSLFEAVRRFARERFPFVRRAEMERLREMDFRNFQSLVGVNVAWQEEAARILGLTVAAEGGRQFPSRAEFSQCLRFLARLSGTDEWRWLLATDPSYLGCDQCDGPATRYYVAAGSRWNWCDEHPAPGEGYYPMHPIQTEELEPGPAA